MQPGKRVHFFVYNNCSRDARVLKEAASLSRNGYEVKIVAVLDNKTVPFEKRDGFEIHRVKRDSLHVKVIRNVKLLFSLTQRLMLLPFRAFTWVLLRVILLSRRISPLNYLMRALRDVCIKYNIPFPTGNVSSDGQTVSSRGTMARVIRNPHRFPIKEYFKAVFYGRTIWARTLGILFGTIGLPFYILARGSFVLMNFIQVKVLNFIKTILMPFHRSSVFEDYYRKAARFCEEHPADILHFHDLHTLPIIDYLSKPIDFHFVYDSHELYTEIHTLNARQKKRYQMIENTKIHEVDHVITVNPSIARELVERYDVEEPSIVMNCPPAMEVVPKASDLLRRTAGLEADETVILYQGGYSTGRGLEELVKAMKWVENGKLVMMGWGPIENDLRNLAIGNGLEDKVRFIPPADPTEVLNYTCGADIGVIPYRAIGLNNYYTSPNKLFEYIQAHVVVAGSNFPELKRIINSYGIGELFDPEDPQSIAACLNSLAASRDKLRAYKRKILKAAARYHWGNEEKTLVNIYQSLGDFHARAS